MRPPRRRRRRPGLTHDRNPNAPAPPTHRRTARPSPAAQRRAATGLPGPTARRGKRRRGSRGGKNRKRPAGTGADGDRSAGERPAGDARDASPAGERSPGRAPHVPGDRRDERAASDRGLTTEDVAAEARTEAGLGEADPADVAKPRIGDTRPAPPGASAAGGVPGTDRNPVAARGPARRASAAAGADAVAVVRVARARTAARAAVVTGAIGDDDGFDIEQLDEETLERRRGRTRKGRPTGRYQMIVHTGDDGTIQMGVLEGRVARSSTT